MSRLSIIEISLKQLKQAKRKFLLKHITVKELDNITAPILSALCVMDENSYFFSGKKPSSLLELRMASGLQDIIFHCIYYDEIFIGVLAEKATMGVQKNGVISYILDNNYRNHGIITHVLTKTMPYLFEKYDYLIANIDPRNTASEALIYKNGFCHYIPEENRSTYKQFVLSKKMYQTQDKKKAK